MRKWEKPRYSENILALCHLYGTCPASLAWSQLASIINLTARTNLFAIQVHLLHRYHLGCLLKYEFDRALLSVKQINTGQQQSRNHN